MCAAAQMPTFGTRLQTHQQYISHPKRLPLLNFLVLSPLTVQSHSWAPDLQRTQGQGQAALTPGSPTAPSPITGAGRERSSACSVLCTAGSLFLLQAGSCCISAKQHKEQHMLGVLTATGQTWVLFSAPHSYWKSLNMTLLPAERFANCFGRCV